VLFDSTIVTSARHRDIASHYSLLSTIAASDDLCHFRRKRRGEVLCSGKSTQVVPASDSHRRRDATFSNQDELASYIKHDISRPLPVGIACAAEPVLFRAIEMDIIDGVSCSTTACSIMFAVLPNKDFGVWHRGTGSICYIDLALSGVG
jgi:hypothetical protein